MENITRWKGPNPTRLGEIITSITSELHPYRIRCIYRNAECRPTDRADYVITMKKNAPTSLEERYSALYQLLSRILKESEKLVTKDKCLFIKEEGYQYSFCVEAYKCADRIIYMVDGKIISSPLHRMGVETLLKNSYLWGLCVKKAESELKGNFAGALSIYNRILDHVYHKMTNMSLINEYPNPADRFVYLVKHEATILKE